jgi:hypothetical protein
MNHLYQAFHELELWKSEADATCVREQITLSFQESYVLSEKVVSTRYFFESAIPARVAGDLRQHFRV